MALIRCEKTLATSSNNNLAGHNMISQFQDFELFPQTKVKSKLMS